MQPLNRLLPAPTNGKERGGRIHQLGIGLALHRQPDLTRDSGDLRRRAAFQAGPHEQFPTKGVIIGQLAESLEGSLWIAFAEEDFRSVRRREL